MRPGSHRGTRYGQAYNVRNLTRYASRFLQLWVYYSPNLLWVLTASSTTASGPQVRDLCQRMVVRKVRVDAEEVVPPGASTPSATTSTTATTSSQQRQPLVAPALDDASGQQPQVVLLAVGRQLVPLLEDAWANDRSAVWHGEVPRSFAPSSLPEYPADMGVAGRGSAGTGSK